MVIVAGASVASAQGANRVQCGTPEDVPPTAVDITKFSLIARYCHAGAAVVPAAAPRAAQLDLYATGQRSGTLVARAEAPPLPTAPAAIELPRAATQRPAALRILALAPTLQAAAERHDIDPLLLHAIAHVESRHNTAAVSPAGARGVMQVMPATARRFGVADPQRELMTAPINVDVSAAYLKTLQARFGNDLSLVLAAYNAGEGAVQRHGNRIPAYPETRHYVTQVLGAYRALRDAVRTATAP